MKRFTSCLTSIVIVFSCSTVLCKQIFDPPPPPDPELQKMQAVQVRKEGGIKYLGRGRLENREAGAVLHLTGSPYEMGYQQGILLKDIIRENVKRNLVGVEPNMDRVDVALDNMPAELLRELKGIGAGSGVDFRYVFGTNIFQYARSKSKGCSNAIMFGESTKDGRLFHIRTFDFRKVEIFNHQVVCFYNPKEGIPFMGILIPGNVHISSGINKRMVSVGIDRVHKCRPVVGGDASHYLVRYIAQYADDIDEATGIVMNAPPITNVILLTVADGKSRTARVFEIISDTERIFRGPRKDFIISTNHLVKRVIAEPTKDSKARYGYYETLIERNYGNIDSKVCLDFLRGYVKYRKGEHYRSYNIHSLLFDPGNGQFLVALKPPFPAAKGKFYPFYFREELR